MTPLFVVRAAMLTHTVGTFEIEKAKSHGRAIVAHSKRLGRRLRRRLVGK